MIKAWSYIEEYKGLRKKILKSIDETLKSDQIFFGKELQKFEKRFVKENNLKQRYQTMFLYKNKIVVIEGIGFFEFELKKFRQFNRYYE